MSSLFVFFLSSLNFGSNKILSGAKLDLAYGRRYGLIGRNGVGKSTLLRNMALREVAIPCAVPTFLPPSLNPRTAPSLAYCPLFLPNLQLSYHYSIR